MQLTVQVISGVLTVAVLVLTIIGVLRTRKANKPVVKRSEPIIKSGGMGDRKHDSSETDIPAFSAEQREVEIETASTEGSSPINDKELEIPEILSITILAEKGSPYSGYELLQALLSNGLRFGKMNIFHSYENPNGSGKIIFSCASAKKPGTFDIKNMGPFSTPGLTFFIQLDHEVDNTSRLDAMLSTAELIILDLGGIIIDDEKKPLKDEKIVMWQKLIRGFEKSKGELVT